MSTVRHRTIIAFLACVTVTVAAGVTFRAWSADAAPGDTGTTFVPLAPCRLVDTRPTPDRVGRFGAFTIADTRTVAAHGTNGNCTISPDAVGLSLNVTAAGASSPTFLTIWPGGPRPLASSLNPVPGQPPTPNAVTTDLSAVGTFDVYNLAGTVDVIIDVNGYHTASSLQQLAATDDALESDVQALQTADAALESDIQALQAGGSALRSDVEALETAHASLTSDVTDLGDAHAALEAAVAEQFTNRYSPYLVPAAAFHADSPGANYFYSFTTGRYSAGDGCHYAPAELPHAATIDSIDFYLYDNEPSDNLTVELVRKVLATTSSAWPIAAGRTSGSSTSIQIITDDTITHPVVDRDYAYYLTLCFPASGGPLEVAGAAIYLSPG